MTTVTARCVVCGDVVMLPPAVFLVAYDDEEVTHCIWRCPVCDEPRLQEISRETTAKLWQAGCQLLNISPGPDTGRLSINDMIDLGLDLDRL